MIPPINSYAPPPVGIPPATDLSQRMQDMKLAPPPSQGSGMPMNYAASSNPIPRSQVMNYAQFNNPQRPPGNQAARIVPHHQGSTTVTYSGPPRATYPYNNNVMPSSQTPTVNTNQFNAKPNHNVHSSNRIGYDYKVSNVNPTSTYNPPLTNTMQQNGISNGHMDMAQKDNFLPHGNSSPLQNQVSSPLQQPQYPGVPQNLSNQQNLQSSSINSLLQPQNSFVPQSPLGAYPKQNYSNVPPLSPPPQLSQQSFQNCQPPPPSMGYTPSPTYPPGSPQYSGLLPSPNSGVYSPPGQPYPGTENAQGPGAYPYSLQSQVTPTQKPVIQLDQMPSTIQFREEDQQARGGYYTTDVKGVQPPLVSTNFIVQDRGMCSPRFIRSTLYCLPNQPDMLKQIGIPFALSISPFASLNEGETASPLALFREEGPLRCKRCKAYICSFMTFMEGGRCFQCAFCKVITDVPQDYFCFLDNMGERTDKYHRPELCLGSFEYMATKEYCRNDQMPNPPAYIFMIEVSHATFRNGLIPLLCENMKNVLQCLKNDEQNGTSKLRIGFVTYNKVLHFYNMKKNLTQPHIMVLSDVHNAFMPLLEGFLVTLAEAEALVDCLMEHIPRLFVNEPATEIILGPVIQVGLEALKNANCSGKLYVFHSSIPNADAPGKLAHREGQKLLGTDKQKTVLSPQNDFYSKLAQECVAAGCAVDLFLFPNAHIDIASMSPLCRHTGGQIYKYTYFQSHIDGDRFLEDLERNVVTPTAFDSVLRVRTSAGISPVFYYGNFYMSNTTDVELSVIDCYKSVTIELAYDDKLPENETVFIQAALLYTTITGERKIRVHNLALATSITAADIFRNCEMDTMINIFAKQALKQVLEIPPQQIKSNLVSRAVKMLTCYRKTCASSSSTTQLLLPDPLKVLPLYINCLLKSDAVNGGSEMSLDDRSFAMLAVNSMDVKSTASYFYPKLVPLHTVNPESDKPPTPIRCSIEKLNDNGAYLLENGIYMFLWIGQAISPEWLQDVFGVQSASQVDKQKTCLPDLDTPLSRRIRSIIEEIEEEQQWYMRLTVMVQGDKLEVVFRQFLVEDRGTDGSPSYIDFLCHLHNQISKNF